MPLTAKENFQSRVGVHKRQKNLGLDPNPDQANRRSPAPRKWDRSSRHRALAKRQLSATILLATVLKGLVEV